MDKGVIESFENDVKLRTVGYSDEITVVFGMKNAIPVPIQTINRIDIVPDYDQESSETVMYLMIPLHIDDECYGYFVTKNHYHMIKDFYMNSLTGHISSALERARQNIKLENLNMLLADISVRDELTGLYNRMGYEKIVIPYLDELRSQNKKSIIMVADINRMKVINDRYGHLQGDNAIKIVSSVIKSSIPKSWKAVRYGGDEYVILGEYSASEDIEGIKNSIINKSIRVAEDMNSPFNLSVSVGYAVIEPDDSLGIEEYFRMADEAMYEMKQEAHNKE